MPDDLLTDAISIDRAKELFTRYVDQVEIENHSFCNRLCWFCPNVFIDRRSVSHQMPKHVFDTIIRGWSEIDYAGALTWSRFHEALASPRIFERLEAARTALPSIGRRSWATSQSRVTVCFTCIATSEQLAGCC